MQTNAAVDWIAKVHETKHDEHAPPAPVEELVEYVREEGSLDKIPALALLDEIAALRKDLANAELRAAMACIEPADDCDCAGCMLARQAMGEG